MTFLENLRQAAEDHPESNGFYFGAVWARNQIVSLLNSKWDDGDNRFRNVLDLVDWLKQETKTEEPFVETGEG